MQSYTKKPESYFAHARKEIAPLLPAHCGRVLEIGCGAGATLGWLRQSGRATHTVGVEIAPEAANNARPNVDEVHCLDFERDTSPLSGEVFDLILCLDVLEHMVDPWTAVDRLARQHLVSGGTLVVSLPNVRHHSVVLPLLFRGRWQYEDAGLLDRTHLRFFTRGTAAALLSNQQLMPPVFHDAGFGLATLKGLANRLTLGIFRDLVVYQYCLAAKKL